MRKLSTPSVATVAVSLMLAAGSTQAQTMINQTSALMGGVTAGDAAGYPVSITQSGHYVLTSDLVVPHGIHAVLIKASNVTLDLNGFAIRSDNTCQVIPGGIACTREIVNFGTSLLAGILGHAANIQVRNGSVVGFAGNGISGVSNIERMRIAQNRAYGILASAVPLRVVDSVITLSGNTAITAVTGAIERTHLISNLGGINLDRGAVVDSLLIDSGGLSGSSGMSTVRGTTVISGNPVNSGFVSAGGNTRNGSPF